MAESNIDGKTHEEDGLPDLRLPIGLFFIVIGIILLVASITNHTFSAGIPIDQDWGIALLLFGVVMAYFGWKAGPEHIKVDDK
jgi:hypothetical protein